MMPPIVRTAPTSAALRRGGHRASYPGSPSPAEPTNVSCSNCGRPICPDCMTVTPVGMRCPECARQRARVTRGLPGLRAGAAPATYALIAINVVVFLAELGGGAGSFQVGGSVYRDGALFGPAVAD